jgi:WD40 repeat protein
MKTQISRTSFDTANNYSGVFQQMGRMITDADWNELSELVQFQIMDALQDVIGSGTPRERGMVKTITPGNYQLHWGHLYVDGIHARALPNEKSANPQFIFYKQADFPAAPVLAAGEYRLYADVWERSVTALEDEGLLDPGLKGADTCTRTQTMAQIKACATSIGINDIQNNASINPAIGTIPVSLSLRAGKTVKDPCDPCADELALQDEVGNYLFRIEVHHVQWTNDAVPQISAITFKWSSENGAEQYVDGETPPGFASSQWCYEFFSGPNANAALHMTSEKHLGHNLTSGFAPIRGQLFNGYPNSKPANLPLVRRWDGFVQLQNAAGVWSVVAGADRSRELSNSYSNTDHAFIDLTGPVKINLNETVLSFDLANAIALAGDYWQAPVRQVIHSAGSVLLDKALPGGIQHHYFVLGRAQIAADGSLSNFIPERSDCTSFDFPPLTDITAKDVCYDNKDCDGPNVRTVQEALDYLCKQRNLKWHNKHLHGMGVVCGLKVQCPASETTQSATATRRITVTEGYALSCDGDDLILKPSKSVDVIEAIEALQIETNTSVLDEAGNGSVYLYIDVGAAGKAELKIAAYDPKIHQQKIFDGTIWMDFYQTCIKDLIDKIKYELDDLNINEINEEEKKHGELISIRRKKFTTLLNLIVYLFYKPHGAYVFTSRKEHIILRDFYSNLRNILQSVTFCGMLKGQEFPEYPFPETGMTTYFGRDHHQLVLVHPNEQFVLTYSGTDTSINIFDVDSETLIATSNVPSGQGGETTAITFSNNGELIYAAVDINGMDSILSRGRFEGGKIVWEASAVLCSVRVADLRFMPRQENFLFIVGIGDGLYVVDTSKLFTEEKIIPAPSYSFNAVGHVAYDLEQERLFATAANPSVGETTSYDRIVILPLSLAIDNMGKSPITIAGHILSSATGAAATGRDGIAISPVNQNNVNELYVVVNGANNNKELRLYNINNGNFPTAPPQIYSQLPDTEITLAYHQNSHRLVVALQDEFRLQLFEQTRLVVERIPVQIMPTALAISNKKGSVFALNFASNTLSAIPENDLEVSAEFNAALAKYRWEVLLAFVALVGNLLQTLKDCFCNLLLMDCPDCNEKEKVWLANITIKDKEVYKICNIGKRKDVWTFPKFEYWLSLVPILPVLKLGVSKICCAIFPNIFSNYADKYQSNTTEYSVVKGETYKQSVHQVKRTDVKVLWRENARTLAAPLTLVRDKLLFNQRKTTVDGVDKQQLRNMETQVAVKQMEQQGLQVEVKEYQGDQAGVVLQQYQQTPKIIPQNSKVTVYQQNGRVLFYAAETKQEGILKLDDSKLAEFEVRKQSLENMQGVEESIARVEARKQSLNETSELQNQLKSLQEEKSKALEDVAALSSQLNLLRTERTKAQQELIAMQSGMVEISTNLKSLQLEVTKVRPVKELTSVDDKTREILHTEGVLTVNDLAGVDSAKLIERGVDAQKVLVMVQEAQNKLKLLR